MNRVHIEYLLCIDHHIVVAVINYSYNVVWCLYIVVGVYSIIHSIISLFIHYGNVVSLRPLRVVGGPGPIIGLSIPIGRERAYLGPTGLRALG